MLERELPFDGRMRRSDARCSTLAQSSLKAFFLAAVVCLAGATASVGAQSNNGLGPSAVRAVGGAAIKAAAVQRRQPSKRRTVRRTPVRTTRAVAGPAFTSPRTASALAVD